MSPWGPVRDPLAGRVGRPGTRFPADLRFTERVLFVVVGAPGSGKSAVVGAVRARLPGVVVIDMDEFLEPAGALAAADLTVAAGHWPAYDALCLRLVGTVVDSGVNCLLLTPMDPDQVGDRFRQITWAVLDCPDDTRRERLRHRPMGAATIEDAIADARALRRLGLPTLESTGTLDDTATAIAAWMHSRRPMP